MAAITQIWILLNIITMLRHVYSQFPFPMYPAMQPMIPIPGPPMPIPVPVPIAIKFEEATTTSTTTTASFSESKEQSIAIAVPLPLPMPIHVALPAAPPSTFCRQRPRPYNCPPCPPCTCNPSCTPAFFSYCSPCHQKCRCRSNDLIPLPLPRYRNKKHYKMSSYSDDSYSSCSSSSSSEWVSRRRKMRRRNKRKSLRNMRRNFQLSDIETSGDELVKPVLTYISRNGDIKFKKKISNDEAAQLLGESRASRRHQNVKVTAEEDDNGKSQLIVISNDLEERANGDSRRRVILREGTAQHVLGEGKKQLIFRPADDKRITNLSVSFQVLS